MIQVTSLGIAILNAVTLVKAAADVITKYDNNHDGLAEFLQV